MNRRLGGRGTRGISSIEVLVAASLSLIVIAAVWGFFTSQQRALATMDLYERTQNVTRSALDLFAREVRMAAYDPTGLALAVSPGPSCPGNRRGIIEGTSTRLRIQQDLNGNGVIGGAGEDVVWDLTGGAIRRTDTGGTPVVLATGQPTNALAFRYYDVGNPPVELVPAGSPAQLSTSQRDCVTKVRITVRARLDNPDPHGAEHQAIAQSEVAIRNRSLTNF